MRYPLKLINDSAKNAERKILTLAQAFRVLVPRWFSFRLPWRLGKVLIGSTSSLDLKCKYILAEWNAGVQWIGQFSVPNQKQPCGNETLVKYTMLRTQSV